MEIARSSKAEFVSHGATGKGNDQIRFELGYYAFNKNIKVIAPWREWNLNSREKLISYANQHGIPLMGKNRKEPPYSMDANLLHISYEGKILEDPWAEPEKKMFRMTKNPEKCSSKGEVVEIAFLKGDAISVNKKNLLPEKILEKLNILGGKHGIGRKDIVENRTVGMKSRGVYELSLSLIHI